MLMKRERSLFEKAMPKIQDNPRLMQIVENYYDSSNKILPVIITGSNTSLPQAFLLEDIFQRYGKHPLTLMVLSME